MARERKCISNQKTMATKTKKQETPEIIVLTGEALLSRVRELGNLTKEEKAKECGYYTIAGDGSERIGVIKFLNALLDAEGIDVDGSVSRSKGKTRGGRSASFKIAVQANGNILVGAAYTKKMELNPGDEFEISLGRRQIKLKQVSGNAELSQSPF